MVTKEFEFHRESHLTSYIIHKRVYDSKQLSFHLEIVDERLHLYTEHLNLSSQIKTFQRICSYTNNMTGAKCGSGSAYPSGTPKIIPHLVLVVLINKCCLKYSHLDVMRL